MPLKYEQNECFQFLAAANMLIFAAGIAEYWPRHNLEPLAFKRNSEYLEIDNGFHKLYVI